MRPRITITNPPSSDSIALGIQPIVIPAGQTVTVDEFPNDSFISAQYNARLYNETEDKFVNWTMDVLRKTSMPDFALYGIMGDNMSRAVTVNLSGPNVVVQIENKEAYDMTFAAFKFIY